MSEAVSAIIPVRDGEVYLAEALDSILAQTVPAAEVIVVDDGSRDSSAAIAEGYGAPVRCVRREPSGSGAALNAGFRDSSGEFIAYLDADDLWTPRKLELQLAAMAEDPEVGLVFGHVERFISPDLSTGERSRIKLPAESAPGLLRGTLLVRRTAMEAVGGYVEHEKLGEFIDWYARAQDRGIRHAMLPDVLMRRRLHASNRSGAAAGDHGDYVGVVREILKRRRAVGGG